MLFRSKDTGMDDMIMWELLFDCDDSLCTLYSRMGQFEKARYHAVQLIANARDYQGPDEADRLIAALSFLSRVSFVESKLPESLAVAEEAYLIASKHYSPAHKTVLKASSHIISDNLLR